MADVSRGQALNHHDAKLAYLTFMNIYTSIFDKRFTQINSKYKLKTLSPGLQRSSMIKN